MPRSKISILFILLTVFAGSNSPGGTGRAYGQLLIESGSGNDSSVCVVDSMAAEKEGVILVGERNRLLLHPILYDPAATTLTFSVGRNQTANRLLGYEYYRASTMRCTMEGASLGASLGLMAGAFGEMTGAWDEKTSWTLGAAMAAMGAFYGGKVKADDPGWSLRIRWDDPHKIEPLEYDRKDK